MQRVPGVFAQNRYNLAQGLRPAIRGFGARAAFGVRGIRVLVDGIPLTLPDGQTELDVLDLTAIQHVDVVRGPASALFGNAAGGVIALRTAAPSSTPSLRIDATAGELGLQRWRASASGPVAGSVIGQASASRQLLDGPRAHGNSQTRRATGRLLTPLAGGEITVRASALDVQAQDPGALNAEQRAADRDQAAPRNVTFDAGERIRQQRVAARWRSGADADAAWDVRGYAGQRLFENRLPFTGGGQVAFDRGFGGLAVSRRVTTGAHRMTVGLDVQAQRDARRRYDNNDGDRGALTLDQTETAESAGVYVADRIALAPAWSLALAGRADVLRVGVDDHFVSDGDDSGDRDFDALSGSLAVTRQIGAVWDVTVRGATAFESPTANELANPDGGGFNPDVDAARATNAELTVTGDWANVGLSATAFRTRITDELVPFEVDGQPGRTFFRNAGESTRQGVELSADAQLAQAWHLHLAYTRSDFVFDAYARDGQDFAGNGIPGIPRQHGFAELAWRGPVTTARLSVTAVGRLFADDANATEVPGYARADLRLAHDLGQRGPRAGRWQLSAGVNNLLDTAYNDNVRINAFGGRFFEPAPGRNVYAGLQLRY